MIDSFRGPDRGVLVLDGGDSVLNVPRQHDRVFPIEQERAATMLRGLGLLGVEGLAVGEAELALGGQELARQARFNAVPLLCANLQDRRGRSPFLARRLVQSGGVRVGLFALYEEPAGRKPAQGQGLRVADAVEAARSQVAALRREGAELVVMLAPLGMSRAREVAAAVPGIHLGLVGRTGWRTNEPEAVAGKTFLVEAGRRGQVLAHLEVRLGEDWKPELSLIDDSRRHVLYLEAGRELAEVRKAMAAPLSAELWRDRLQPKLERARLLARQLEAARAPVGRHSLISRLVELDESAPQHAAMQALLRSAQGGAAAPPALGAPAMRMPAARMVRRRARTR